MSAAQLAAPTPAVGPYRLTVLGRAAFVTLATFATFPEALAAFARCSSADKAIVNDDLRDAGSGLTDTESDAVYSLPVTRVATEAELAAALAAALAVSP